MKSSRTNLACHLLMLTLPCLQSFAQDCYWTNETPLPGERIGRLVVFDSIRSVSTFVAIDGLWSWDGSAWSFVPADYPLVGGGNPTSATM